MWKFKTAGDTRLLPSRTGGFFGSQDGDLYTVAPGTGENGWSLDMGTWVTNIAVAHETVYSAGDDGHLYAASLESRE